MKGAAITLETILKSFEQTPWLREAVFGLLLILFCVIIHFIVRNYVLRGLHYALKKTNNKWGLALFEQEVFKKLPRLVPALILYQGITFFPTFAEIGRKIIGIWIFVIIIYFLDKLLNGILVIYNTYPIANRRPIKGYIQIIKIILYLLSAVVIISLLLDQSPWVFLSGLGALTAVLMLIFQSTILSFTASLQIMGNDMLRVGDWLEVPKYGADGSVMEVALHTIKVRNWDNTVTTIPTHKLIEDSFKNWRGMSESGGRRIKRSLLIDQRSIAFLDEQSIARLEEIHLLKEYLQKKKTELKAFNDEHGFATNAINGRRLTNIGTFRAYVGAYLRQHPMIHQGMILLVRQLQPTTEGLPLELYVFVNDVAWVNYENAQSDIFDHLLAVLPEFGLRVFQKPSGFDLTEVLNGHYTIDE